MKLLEFIAVAAMLLVAAVSCRPSSEGEADPAASVAGTYYGTLALSVMGQDQGSSEASVTIEAPGGGTATVTLSGFGMGAMSLGDIVIPGVPVSESDEGYSLSAGSIDVTAGEMNVTGTMEGTVSAEGSASITFVLRPGAMPMDVTAVFTGSR